MRILRQMRGAFCLVTVLAVGACTEGEAFERAYPSTGGASSGGAGGVAGATGGSGGAETGGASGTGGSALGGAAGVSGSAGGEPRDGGSDVDVEVDGSTEDASDAEVDAQPDAPAPVVGDSCQKPAGGPLTEWANVGGCQQLIIPVAELTSDYGLSICGSFGSGIDAVVTLEPLGVSQTWTFTVDVVGETSAPTKLGLGINIGSCSASLTKCADEPPEVISKLIQDGEAAYLFIETVWAAPSGSFQITACHN